IAEHPHFAHALLRHAAGGEIRDRAVRELEADIGDVDLRRQHRHTDRADLDDLLPQQRLHEVDVVDHQVEQDVDVERARHEDAQALGLEVADVADEVRDGGDRWVVSLDVAYLYDAAARRRDVDQLPRFVDARRNRLLDHHIDAGFEELPRDVVMRRSRRGHDRAIDVARQIGDRVEAFQAETRRDLVRDVVVHLDEAGDVHVRNLGEDSRMQPAEIAGADDAGSHQRITPRCEPRTNSTRYRASG